MATVMACADPGIFGGRGAEHPDLSNPFQRTAQSESIAGGGSSGQPIYIGNLDIRGLFQASFSPFALQQTKLDEISFVQVRLRLINRIRLWATDR
jgi:hypothetical protein